MNYDINHQFPQVRGLLHARNPRNCLVGQKYLESVMDGVIFQMAALMVLMIEIMMVCCLDPWMALQIVLTMARLTVHCLVLHFQHTMDVYSRKAKVQQQVPGMGRQLEKCLALQIEPYLEQMTEQQRDSQIPYSKILQNTCNQLCSSSIDNIPQHYIQYS